MTYYGPPPWEANHPLADQSGYPLPPAATHRLTPRFAPQWSGGLLAAAGLITIVGSFLIWANVVVGDLYRIAVAGTDDGNDGWVTAFLGAFMVALGIVIIARQGRLWVGIVGIVAAALTVFIALGDLGNASEAGDVIRATGIGRVEIGPGLVLVLLAGWAALGASIVAVAVRRASA